MLHTWFLGADFQLHILAYPILVAIKKTQITKVRMIITGLISFSIFWSILKLNRRQIPASLNALFQVLPEEFYLDMQDVYYPTQNHLISYFVGISTSYYLQNKQTSSYKSNLLLLPAAVSILSIFFPIYWTRVNGPSDVQTKLGFVYFIFTKFIHPISIACICLWSIPRTLKFRSSILMILSRLSFSIYLIHLPIIWHFLFTVRQPVRLEIISILFFSGGILMFTIPFSVIFHLFIEAPYSNICVEMFIKMKHEKKCSHHNPNIALQSQNYHKSQSSNVHLTKL